MKKQMKGLISLGLMLSMLTAGGQKRNISLDDVWNSGALYPKMVSGLNNLKDGKTYVVQSRDKRGNSTLEKFNYSDGKSTGLLVDGSKVASSMQMTSFRFSSFALSEDETTAILGYNMTSIYRHSKQGLYVVVDLATYKTKTIFDHPVRYAQLSPDASKVAFVYENNLYIKDLNKGKLKQVTKDGQHNHIINGAVDWVYEEEFSMSRGFEWNADGTSIAYYRFDESRVKEWTMKNYDGLYPTSNNFKYPKAGEQNSIVDVYICTVKNGKSKKLELGSERDQYLPRIQWTKNPDILSVQRLNRHQNEWELLMVQRDGSISEAIKRNSRYYVEIVDHIHFLNDGKHMILPSEHTGFNQLYFHKVEGPQVFQITKGNHDVDRLLGIDEKEGTVYYTSGEDNPTERHIFKISVEGKNKTKLTTKPGFHTARFSADFSFGVHTFVSASEPYVYQLRNKSWDIVRTIEDNQAFNNNLDSSFVISPIEFGTLPNGNGEDLNYYMIKPANFNDTTKYPLLMYVYGGPGSQTVKNSWGWNNYFWYQHLANEYGYIIVSVDNRGTGARGEEFKKMTYQQLGKYETEDQIAAAKHLGSLNYIDESRIGIWGWSYGGYMSSLCLAKGNGVFKMAIAVAPVTNWRFYDNIYTERYMRTPQENASGYDDNSPINHVEKIKGKYLIVHGTGDDNVHFQNAAEMVKTMISKNIPFDSEYYPNKNHGISGGMTRLHLYNKMTAYLLEHL